MSRETIYDGLKDKAILSSGTQFSALYFSITFQRRENENHKESMCRSLDLD